MISFAMDSIKSSCNFVFKEFFFSSIYFSSVYLQKNVYESSNVNYNFYEKEKVLREYHLTGFQGPSAAS